MTWLAVLPLLLVRAHLTMLPRLEAEEAIAQVNQTAVGSGRCDPAGVRALTDRWTQAASGGTTAARVARRDPAELRQLGIKVQRVPRKPKVILTDGL